MPDYDFQHLVAALLRGMGYYVSWVAPPGPDGGMDIIAHVDPLGAQVPRIKVQVKHRQDRTTPDQVRSFMSLLGADDVGIFVSSGGFTKQTHDEVRADRTRRITLIDLDRLFELWQENFHRLSEDDKRRLPLRSVSYLAPAL